jgi:hypothetical protein
MNPPSGYALLGLMDFPANGDVYTKRGEENFGLFDDLEWPNMTEEDRVEYEFFRPIPKGCEPRYQLVSVKSVDPDATVLPNDIVVKGGIIINWFDAFTKPIQCMGPEGYLTCHPNGYGGGEWTAGQVCEAEKAHGVYRPYARLFFDTKKSTMLGRITSYNAEPLPLP